MKVVFDLQDRRAAWQMPDWVEGRLRDALLPGATLFLSDVLTDGSGDGSARVDPRVLAEVEDADVYMGYGISADVLLRGRRLRWVHTGSAGVGSSLTPEMRAAGIPFTNSAGVHAAPMAETVLGMLLHFARGLDVAVRAQAEGRWSGEALQSGVPRLVELGRSTVGVVGFGGIGREVAVRAAAFGARVLALRRRQAEPGERPPPPNTDVLHGPGGLARLLSSSDFVVLAAPATRETDAMIGRAELAAMRPGAVLINVSRGALVDEDALIDALRAGRLRGAALDVFRAEPLPEGHPLWSLPNVLITPHVSAVSSAYWDRETALIVENLRRFQAGEPLVNRVDLDAGY